MSFVARTGLVSFLAAVSVMSGCSASPSSDGGGADSLEATIGPEGGEIIGQKGSKLEGVHVVIPAGALATKTALRVHLADDATPLPATAVKCGPIVSIEPAGLALAAPASVTLPFDETAVTAQNRIDDDVKVWVRQGAQWGQSLQTDSHEGSVTIDLATLGNVAAGVNPPKDVDVVRFRLAPNPKFLKCLAQYPDDPTRAPSANVIVVRGEQVDTLALEARYIKPNLAFDVFTVEHSPLTAAGVPDPSFTNFGMAWYQSDLQARDNGRARTTIRTILLDQIFGFDPAATLPPTATLHVGFWFNDPKDAEPCGFDVTKPTPFNGDHLAGPLAMISTPDATTALGPLCTKPDTSVTPARCSP
jgi:hypothetical protein